jgi:ribosomal protein S18 acetylase RimI-like enzyme
MVSIRLIHEHDVAAFQALRLRGLQESPDAFGATYDEFMQEAPATILERTLPKESFPEKFVLGAFDAENAFVGVVGCYRESRQKSRHKAWVWGMYVAPEVRGQGIGKQLMQALLSRCATISGIEQIHLGVVTTNVAARHLYETLGFRVYGVEPHALKDGERYLDEAFMSLLL